ncbi:prolyl oligopeptidase family serine peptidase [Sphingomonas sp. MMS24-JH45]
MQEELAFLEKISPYRNIRKGVAYPEPIIWTTTKDDRVGPQHARQFTARLKEYGLPYLLTRIRPAAIGATRISSRARGCRRCR